MARRRRATPALAILLACLTAGADAGAFDPRRLADMPGIDRLPDPRLTADEVKAECLRLFDGTRYGMTMAIQNYARSVDSPATFLAPVLAGFRTDGRVATDPATARPVCAVLYSWRDNWRWPSMGRDDLAASFDGRILYRFDPPPDAKTGVLMVVQGDALQLTEFFLYPVDRDAAGRAQPGARVYRQWGLYRRE